MFIHIRLTRVDERTVAVEYLKTKGDIYLFFTEVKEINSKIASLNKTKFQKGHSLLILNNHE